MCNMCNTHQACTCLTLNEKVIGFLQFSLDGPDVLLVFLDHVFQLFDLETAARSRTRTAGRGLQRVPLLELISRKAQSGVTHLKYFLTKHSTHRVSSVGKSSRIFGRISLPSSGDGN